MAAIAVVFIHVLFPGKLGSMVNCLARLAVPFFFAISGYYSFNADTSRLRSRARSILKLYVLAVILSLGWGFFREMVIYGTSPLPWLMRTMTFHNIACMLLLQIDFLGGGHLWYLLSLMLCYVVLQGYIRWKGKDYRDLYLFSGIMLTVCLITESFTSAAGITVSNYLYRNTLLLGLPLFTLGLFLGQYQETLRSTYNLAPKSLLILFCLGVVVSVLQWMPFGELELPIGTLIQLFALMLLVVNAPNLVRADSLWGRMIAHFASLSTTVYITHLIWSEIYFLRLYPGVVSRLGGMEPYLRPVLVAALSLGTGVIWVMVKKAVRQLRPNRAAVSDTNS